MEEQQSNGTAQNVTGESKTPVVESPTTEQKTVESNQASSAPENQNNESTDSKPVDTKQEVKQTRAEKRLMQLLEKGKENKTPQSEQPNQGYQPQMPIGNRPYFYEPRVQPGQEISPDQYKADVTRSADEIASLRVTQLEQKMRAEREAEKTINNFNSEVETIYRDYPGLENNSQLDETISKLYKEASGGKPNAKLLRTIADNVMAVANHAETEGQSQVTNKLVQQANEAAISPTGGRTESMSIDAIRKIKDPAARVKEMEKHLSVAR